MISHVAFLVCSRLKHQGMFKRSLAGLWLRSICCDGYGDVVSSVLVCLPLNLLVLLFNHVHLPRMEGSFRTNYLWTLAMEFWLCNFSFANAKEQWFRKCSFWFMCVCPRILRHSTHTSFSHIQFTISYTTQWMMFDKIQMLFHLPRYMETWFNFLLEDLLIHVVALAF